MISECYDVPMTSVPLARIDVPLTTTQIVDVANAVGLFARILEVPPDSLAAIALPAVLHWKVGHFVVLVGVDDVVYRVHDPTLGAHDLDYGSLLELYSGIVVEFGQRPWTL